MKFRTLILGAVAFALTACASTPSGPVKALPPEFIDAAMEAAMAETIAEECRALAYNEARENKVLTTYAVRLAAAGYTERDLRVGAKKMESDPRNLEKAISMITDRKIDVTNEASWCKAGYREVRSGTNIGKYLIRN